MNERWDTDSETEEFERMVEQMFSKVTIPITA